MSNATLTEQASETQKVVILNIGGLKLILPQADIRAVESIVDVNLHDPPDNGAGWVAYQGQRWPVYCLSDELRFLCTPPDTRRACVLMTVPGGYLGLICDDVRVLVRFSASCFDLPLSMRLPMSPVSGLVSVEDSIACVSDAGRLANFVAHAASSPYSSEHDVR